MTQGAIGIEGQTRKLSKTEVDCWLRDSRSRCKDCEAEVVYMLLRNGKVAPFDLSEVTDAYNAYWGPSLLQKEEKIVYRMWAESHQNTHVCKEEEKQVPLPVPAPVLSVVHPPPAPSAPVVSVAQEETAPRRTTIHLNEDNMSIVDDILSHAIKHGVIREGRYARHNVVALVLREFKERKLWDLW